MKRENIELNRLLRLGRFSSEGSVGLPRGSDAGAATCKLRRRYFKVALRLVWEDSRCEARTLEKNFRSIEDVHAYGSTSITAPGAAVGVVSAGIDLVLDVASAEPLSCV